MGLIDHSPLEILVFRKRKYMQSIKTKFISNEFEFLRQQNHNY